MKIKTVDGSYREVPEFSTKSWSSGKTHVYVKGSDIETIIAEWQHKVNTLQEVLLSHDISDY